ncbi:MULTISPECIES: universal stress protein [Ralstonia solanacearum species complex]|uniref:universal stress protein n=1 Tax=Ralstonia solanacearum species complex TaxID=3116862 RepID=UPI000E586800|nr:universal stress protein [Ralstonia solanacearum]BEU71813.1 universal stress protein [Ralstonia pseudosolanacearum]AXV78494.1 universal stress protein UspA [Ralstonia solanacearum]AXV90755.1 universal stress protein UspA [Ralstonia solanacearum]AXW20572.1 universal stress protein UspA [Ralstonia solanacearum]AXW77405.1 universal stress protein UspA [Ralstonia solanacearum]
MTTTIMVHLDTSQRAMDRLDLAVRYATAHRARLIAVFASFTPDPGWFYMMEGASHYLEDDRVRRCQARDAVHAGYRERVQGLSIETEWRALEGEPVAMMVREAREADLVIIGQRHPDDPQSYIAAEFVETVILEAGRPVLVVPYAGRFDTLPQRIVLAWDGGREAARAIHDAIPLMAGARVQLLEVISVQALPPLSRTGAGQAARALHAHRIEVEVQEATCDGADVMIGELLLSRAADFNADLLVMGAYGRTRLRELILGGVTRTLLASMTVPVLMSH